MDRMIRSVAPWSSPASPFVDPSLQNGEGDRRGPQRPLGCANIQVFRKIRAFSKSLSAREKRSARRTAILNFSLKGSYARAASDLVVPRGCCETVDVRWNAEVGI